MIFKNRIKQSVPDNILNDYYRIYGYEKPFCRAPFNALYFPPNGDVSACCLNKSFYCYGKYPMQSISEILKSKERKQHQYFLMQCNLSKGCGVCENNLLCKNFAGLMSTNYRNQHILKYITQIDFELSHNCNLNCIMCHRIKTSSNTVYGDAFFDEIKPYLEKLEFANFVGGEPFLIDVYYKIWDYIIKNNPSCIINIQSNGTLMNDRIAKVVSCPNVLLGISLDAINEDTYRVIRRNAELKDTLKNFEIFLEAMRVKNHSLQISVCPLTLNAYEIPDIINFANLNKCKIYFNQVTFPNFLSLKFLSSIELSSIIRFYETVNLNTPKTEDYEKANADAFAGLIELLKSWHCDATKNESDKVIINKNEVLGILGDKLKADFPDLYLNIENLLPAKWFISRSKIAEFTHPDFIKSVQKLSFTNLNAESFEKFLITFFEIK